MLTGERFTAFGAANIEHELTEQRLVEGGGFTKGQRVKTPMGPGSVAYQRMAPPTYSKPQAVSVVLDSKRGKGNYTGTIFDASKVKPLKEFSEGPLGEAKKTFQAGDIVRYTAKFRRNTGMVTGGPVNGKVVGFVPMGGGRMFPKVHWSHRDDAVPVAPENIELDPRHKRRRESVENAPGSISERSGRTVDPWSVDNMHRAKLVPSKRLGDNDLVFAIPKHGKRLEHGEGTLASRIMDEGMGAGMGGGSPKKEFIFSSKEKAQEFAKSESVDSIEEAVGHHHKSGGKWYADTAFLNNLSGVLPGFSMQHIGFGEFALKGPDGEIEFDRVRGKEFEGQSGRSHQVYDNKGGKLVAKLIKSMEQKGKSKLVEGRVEEAARVGQFFVLVDKKTGKAASEIFRGSKAADAELRRRGGEKKAGQQVMDAMWHNPSRAKLKHSGMSEETLAGRIMDGMR